MAHTQDRRNAYAHVTPSHEVLLWPFIRSCLTEYHIDVGEDLHMLAQEGSLWFIQYELQKHSQSLSPSPRLEAEPYIHGSALNSANRVHFLKFTYEEMSTDALYYFNTFNMLYFILDRQHFMEVTLPKVAENGFEDGDFDSIIALLVFALGKVAVDGTFSSPLENGMPFQSGLRGGTLERPPGLDIFNEARQRFGFVANQCSIKSIEISLLSAIYYESCGRHLDCWHATLAASSAFQIMMKCTAIDWFTIRGNILKRLYWTCRLIEDWYYFDLDLPRTEICDYEDNVPLPGELWGQSTEEDQQTVMHLLAMIALHRVVTRIHKFIFNGMY
ncbi:Transcription factor fungi [Macrophomina phaseolina MS6]|uniref:Transcription factor fungi n=1 Tax=Macrophomina phaseolina (strain MS6) TaxID=1126212 RepID=K2RXJ8_MACPH|nr:Transcription factor fungi [Macrophomina phaseolina MS6]